MQAELPPWAADYIGIPYATGGRDRSGADCWGLMCLVWKEQFGHPLPAYEGVDWFKGQRPKVIGGDAVAYVSQFEEVRLGEERLGDGLVVRMRGYPFHVGLVLAPGWMLHTHQDAGSVIENYHEMRWRSRIAAIYRYSP